MPQHDVVRLNLDVVAVVGIVNYHLVQVLIVLFTLRLLRLRVVSEVVHDSDKVLLAELLHQVRHILVLAGDTCLLGVILRVASQVVVIDVEVAGLVIGSVVVQLGE